ncbi:MAG TPA: VCBS repeat-containing protein, partial [Candidatus Saccharimonadia bacterium]|nr:VCBS repeat-containing protein [Candidatus Saccharimonadia bacterium]
AVAMTWNLSIRRTRNGVPGKFILTGYSPGSIATCGAERNGYRLYQRGVKACAKAGLTYEQIARIYYGRTLQLTDPGRHNIVGGANGPGDSGAVVPDGSGIDVHVLQSSGSAFVVGASPDSQPTDDSTTLARISADLDGDGFDELISLIADGPTSQHLEVRKPNGLTYGPVDDGLAWDSVTAGVTFASERDGAPGIQLVAGDFDNDYDDDLALVVTGEEPASGSIVLLRSSKTSFQPLVETYAGVFDPGTSRAFAGDVTGDGRADIVLETPGTDGLSFRVLATTKTDWLLADPVTWYTAAGLTMDATRSILADVDRDGRDDIVLALASGTKTIYRGLRSTGSAFSASDLYSSSIGVSRIKLATSDVDHDGRGDMVVFARLADGSPGTRIYVYRSKGTSLAGAELWREDLGLDWQAVEPY